MRALTAMSSVLVLAACAVSNDPGARHGSPLHTYICAGGKTFQARQLMTGEIEVTAGGQTRDAADANGDPIPGGPQLSYSDAAAQLTGMPGGPYEACVLSEDDA